MSLIKPDILITIGDYWNFIGFEQLKPKFSYSFKWIAYYTIESEPINEMYHNALTFVDEFITPSKYGQKVVEDSLGRHCHYIPYGINHEKFYVLEDNVIRSERAKRNLNGKFRFISVAKNISRKNIPAFLEAMKICHDVDKNIVAYLHTDIDRKNKKMVHIPNILKRLGLESVVSLPERKVSFDLGISDEHLNVEYNCSDAFVCTSVAEGFGLPIIESQKCGLTPITTNASSMKELVENKGELVLSREYYANMEHKVGIIDVEDLADKMLKVAKLKKNKCKSKEIINFSKGFLWEGMNKQILDIIKSQNKVISVPIEEI